MVKRRNRLKFTACCRQEVSKASIPQILFQAIVASFRPRKPAFLRLFLVGIMAKNYTALNKEKRILNSKFKVQFLSAKSEKVAL